MSLRINQCTGDEPLQSMFESCLRAKKKNAGTSLTVACTDMLVTLAKGWLCWDDEKTVQEFYNGYICLECYQTVHVEVFII